MDGVLDITDDLDVYVEEDNNNNVDAKEEEDNNMDVLCVQTFHNDKFWRECWQMQTLCKSFLMSEEFEDPHGHYTLEKGLLHVKYVLKCFFLKVKTTHETICWVKALIAQTLKNFWQVFNQNHLLEDS